MRALKPTKLVYGAALLVALTACSKDDPILQGKRENIRSVLSEEDTATLASSQTLNKATPLKLPPVKNNANWAQSPNSPAFRTDHPALRSSPQLAWSVPIGAGDGKRARITADPVVSSGRVFTLDAHATVTAVSTAGQVIWSQSLVPANESAGDASGGGLAVDGKTLYVSSGFGLLTALDVATGNVRWQQNMRSTGTGTPTVVGDLVYVVAGDEIAWAVNKNTGRIEWQLVASPDINNVSGAPAPAVSNKYVIFSFGSGEVQGAFLRGGLRAWDAQVAGQRPGYSNASIGDITGGPLIAGDKVFIGNHSGRLVAVNVASGKRIWTALDGPLNQIWPAGDSIFIVSDRNELIRMSANDGSRIWARTLPFFTKTKPRKQSEIYAHHGPILAGGRLIVASNDGKMRFFNPQNGAPLGEVELPGGATTNPVVAGGTLYVVSSKGQLLAFR